MNPPNQGRGMGLMPPPQMGGPPRPMGGDSRMPMPSFSSAPGGPLPFPPAPGRGNLMPPFMRPPQGAFQSPQMPHPQPAFATPQKLPPPSDVNWTEHTAPDGRKYYYNKVTKVSTYEKPVEMMTEEEKKTHCPWKEFTSDNGRKYYYNNITKESRWEKPADFREETKSSAPSTPQQNIPSNQFNTPQTMPSFTTAPFPAPNMQMQSPMPGMPFPPVSSAPAAPSTATPAAIPVTPAATAPAAEEPKEEEAPTAVPSKVGEMGAFAPINMPKVITYATRKEALEAFKGLLTEHKIASDMTWDSALRLIVNDPRYKALRTLGERKAAFNEYTTAKRKEEREEKRIKVLQKKEEFFQMLAESPEVDLDMRYRKARIVFAQDPRFQAIESDRDKEVLFQDYITELERKQKEERRAKQQAAQDGFKQLLADNKARITCRTQWRKAKEFLAEDERYAACEKMARLLLFQDYIKELLKEDELDKAAEKAKLKRQDRKYRDAFRALLDEMVSDRKLNHKTKWKDILPTIKGHTAYTNMLGTKGSSARQLFDDRIEDLEEEYGEIKKRFKDMLKEAGYGVTVGTPYTEFAKYFAYNDTFESVPPDTRQMIYAEFCDKAELKEREQKKKHEKAKLAFKDLLKRKQYPKDVAFEDVCTRLSHHSCTKVLSTEEKKEFFDAYMQSLCENGGEGGKEPEENEDRERGRSRSASPHSPSHSRSRSPRSRSRSRSRSRREHRGHRRSHKEKKREREYSEDSDDHREHRRSRKEKRSRRD